MEAYLKSKSFIPVILELETQAEVDIIYALLNFVLIADLIDEYGIDDDNYCGRLEEYADDEGHNKFHILLMKKFMEAAK